MRRIANYKQQKTCKFDAADTRSRLKKRVQIVQGIFRWYSDKPYAHNHILKTPIKSSMSVPKIPNSLIRICFMGPQLRKLTIATTPTQHTHSSSTTATKEANILPGIFLKKNAQKCPSAASQETRRRVEGLQVQEVPSPGQNNELSWTDSAAGCRARHGGPWSDRAFGDITLTSPQAMHL